MKNTMGIILTGGKKLALKELSAIRSSSAIPVGGKYRAIDFVLSNMVNSGITSIGVLTQYSFRSLMDHLGGGKEWDLDRRNGGLFVFPPYLSDGDSGWYRGTADAMYNNISYLEKSFEEYVLIATGNCVYKMNFDEMLNYHISKNADITVAVRDVSDFELQERSHMGIVKLDGNERIVDFQEKPHNPDGSDASMGIYIMKRTLLISLLEESAAHGNYDFVKDVLIKKLWSLNIFGYRFEGYWRSLSSVQIYYKTNMELLDRKICNELFYQDGKIYTKVKDETPAKYNEEAEVVNSIVADGCIIEGYVENCILFRGVEIKRGAIVKDSIILQGAVIEQDANIQYAILDKNVVLTTGKHLKGELNWPIIIGKEVIV